MYRLVAPGLAGGAALNLSMLLTFRLLGFGWYGGGVLLDPSVQSSKLIVVWTELEPIPIVISNPPIIIAGLFLFGVLHSVFYGLISQAWPEGVFARGMRMAVVLFFLVFLFWEFFTPFNMFGEPPGLIGLELLFWALISATEGFTIASVHERMSKGEGR